MILDRALPSALLAILLSSSPACGQSSGHPADSIRARGDSVRADSLARAGLTVRKDSAIRATSGADSGAAGSRRDRAGTVADSTRDTVRSGPPSALRDDSLRPRETPATVIDTATRLALDTTAGRDTTRARPRRKGDPVWPVGGPTPMRNSLLPHRRIIAYYGNPLSKRMGILGELPPDSMLKRLDAEVAAWNKADSTTPVKPALHLIAVVAQAGPGSDGKYRLRMTDSMIEMVAKWAETRNALVFLDVQIGLSTVEAEVTRLEKFLKRPNFHLALDPEFAMIKGGLPGKRIGTLDAKHINWAIDYLAGLVDKYGLAPKVLVVHRFTRPMLTNASKIELDPRVQVVVQMDGWGPPRLKRDSYEAYVWKEPVQFTGFKLFYKNDTKAGHPLMKPLDVLKLDPKPVYIQYQ